MNYSWASATDIGRVRDHNEDAVAPHHEGEGSERLVAGVADGMGGHVGGEVASAVALDAALATGGDVVARVEAANRAVVDAAKADPRLWGMGTTLTLAVIADDTIDIGHIGDSRAYLLHDGGLTQLTDDHSLIAEMVASGELDPSDASHHPYRSVITRAIGLDETVEVDRVQRDLVDGDRLLLCTDGLTSMVDDSQIRTMLEDQSGPAETARALVDAANAAGGFDNTSVVVVHITGDTAD